MLVEIESKLAEVASAEQVRIVYAVESGSRAWGFASRDSDYDVRFLYLRPRAWYLRIDLDERRDVLERPIDGRLDLVGWDLRKALRLLWKSNPPLLEWLASPLVYLAEREPMERLRALVPRYYAPLAAHYHYLHMADGNYREYLRGETVRLKKYLYVLRPLLAVRFMERHGSPPPMEFARLLADEPGPDSSPLKAEIADLLARKMAGEELDSGPRRPVLNHFIETELERLAASSPPLPQGRAEVEPLNELFRWALDWAGEGAADQPLAVPAGGPSAVGD